MSEQTVLTIIPVAPTEPLHVIKQSVASLDDVIVPDGVAHRILYVIDTEDRTEDERISFLEDGPAETVVRQPGTGRRAGAINAGLDAADDPDFVALFDIDSRPQPSFLTAALDTMQEHDDDVFLVSGPRRIVNADENFVTRMVDTEFTALVDMQRLLDRIGGFSHYNGLIGLLDADCLRNRPLNEAVMCEDFDFSTDMYTSGKRTELNPDLVIGEQAVTSLSQLFDQKRRWLTGAVEGVRDHATDMLRGRLPWRVKATWFTAVTLPFFSFLLSPLAPLYGVRSLLAGEGLSVAAKRTAGFFIFSWLVTGAGIAALYRALTGKGVEWTPPDRTDH